MTIGTSGLTLSFERFLLNFASTGRFKLALFTDEADINSTDTTAYAAGMAGEVDPWSEYQQGGVNLTARIGQDGFGFYIDFDDVDFTAAPSDLVVHGGMIYLNDQQPKVAVAVLNFGQDFSPNGGLLSILLERRELSNQPVIRLHSG